MTLAVCAAKSLPEKSYSGTRGHTRTHYAQHARRGAINATGMSDPSPGDVEEEHNKAVPGSSCVARQQEQERNASSSKSSNDSVDGEEEQQPRPAKPLDAGCKSWPGDGQNPHGIHTIQGCGYLVAVKEDASVASGTSLVGLSENITNSPWWSCVGRSSAADLLGKDLADVFRPEFTDIVRVLLQRLKKSPGALSLPQKKIHGELISPDGRNSDQVLTCSLAPRSTGVYLLEVELMRDSRLEPDREGPAPDPGLLHVANMMRSIPVGSTPQLCTTILCDALMEVMPAYDRILAYRFAADASGEVIHESTQPGSTVGCSYLGRCFPAEDIPPVADEPLFKRCGVRFIADTSAQAVPVASSFGRNAPLDVSITTLRAPVERHRSYLRSIGVTANMAVAIIVQDELWGLFIFHSYAGVVVPTIAERIMVEIAAALSAKAITRYELDRTARLSRALEHISSYTRVQDFLAAEHRTLLGIFDLDSIVMWEPQSSVLVFGDSGVTLSPKECEGLVADGGGDGGDKPIAFRSTEAKGVAFFSVRSFLLAFLRESLSRQVAWAGKKPGPPPPSDSKRALLHPGAEAAVGWQAWSRRTVVLLGIMRHGVSAQLYTQALSADNTEMLAHVCHELRTPFHGVMSSLEALLEERGSLGAEEKVSILRSAMDAGESM